MKADNIRNKSEADLRKLLTQKRRSLQSFRFGATGSKVKNVKEGQNTKKDIARILTELRVRETQAQ